MKQSEQLEDFVEPFDDAAAKQDEGLHVEKKSSIVFDQATSKPDLNNQLGFNIMKEIAAFANTEGGYLYIGIKNNGEVVGVEKDYTHLNEGVTGLPPRFQYPADWDHYRLIILDVASKRLQSDIDRLIRITKMPASSGKTVCRIYVKPCRDNKPVFYHFLGQQRLFVRSDGKVVERTAEAWEREIENWPNRLNALPPPETDSENGFYFSILDDGTISLREKKRNGQSIRCRVPVPARKHIKGWLLFVFNDGTLQFIDPNRILSEIQTNKGYSTTRINNPARTIGAFFYQGNAYVLVTTVWQDSLDGFKCFFPEELFKSGIEHGSSKRFLAAGEVEARDCYLVPKGAELEKFWLKHPFRKSDPFDPLVTVVGGSFHSADKADYGSLVRDVEFRLYMDLIHLAKTGHMPVNALQPAPSSFFVRAFCRGKNDEGLDEIGFKVEKHAPAIRCLTAADETSAKLRCCYQFSMRGPHQSFIEIKSTDNLFDGRMVVVLSPMFEHVPTLLFSTDPFPNFPGTDNEQVVATLPLPPTSILKGFFFAGKNDYLVVVDCRNSLVQFYLFPVNEIPYFPRSGHPPRVDQFCHAFREWGKDKKIIAAGILQNKKGKTDLDSLPRWLSGSEWYRTPQCPIRWFDLNVWIKIRSNIRSAVICRFRNDEVVESPVRYNESQLSLLRSTTSPAGKIVNSKNYVISRTQREQMSPDEFHTYEQQCYEEGAPIDIVDDDELLRRLEFQPFMVEKGGEEV